MAGILPEMLAMAWRAVPDWEMWTARTPEIASSVRTVQMPPEKNGPWK
jgi:hypothetical protein